MKKIIYILFFVFLVCLAGAIAAVPFPIQVYGDIAPDLPQEYGMSFQIDDVEYETGIAETNYGYTQVVKIPVDDDATPAKEGYELGDSVEVYINDVLIDTQTYPYIPTDAEYLPYEINISLTQEQYNEIIEILPPECARQRCTSAECQASESVCESVGCSWSGGQCRFPSSNGGRRPPGGASSTGCYDEWQCPDIWTECSVQGIQTRTCINIGTCKDARPTKVETQTCIYVPPVVEEPEIEIEIPIEEPTPEIEEEPEAGFPWLIMILVVIILGAGGAVFYELRKSRIHLAEEKTKHPSEVHPDTYSNLESYIRGTLEMGYTREQIKQALINEGWNQQIIINVFSRIR